MDNSNEKKRALLGENPSTARLKLIKSILFSLLQKHGEDSCFRCGEKIEKIEELSIEHKESWQLALDPVAMFYALENISFSHLQCNRPSVYTGGRGKRKVAPEGMGWCFGKQHYVPVENFFPDK